MANLLVIEKQTGGYFKFTLNGDTATAVTSIKNDLLAVGTQLHFKTGNGANIIKEQFIYPEDVTIISGGTFTFTTVAQVWNKLIEIDYFAWLGNGGAGGVSRFDDLADTFEYVGQAGKVVVVDNSELKLIPVTFYNKRLFTDLEDTPNSLVPNKMVVVNPEGSALILQDQPQAPEQLLNSVGYFDYNDLATQTTPLNAVTNVPLKLVNDTEGVNTSTSENPYGVSYVWDYTTNQFNFSELSIGDTIDLRIHVQVTTTTANQKVNLDAKFGIGSVAEFTNSIYSTVFKTAGVKEISFVAPFYMGSTYITDYPAELYLTTDASATVKVNGWYVRIIRKNINIITVDYEVPDATTLAKGIVRLAGDLGGTANSPTVPGLANKVPTSRIIETTSPLLGGGALTSDLVLGIQQANSVQSGYLSFADWSTFNNKANDAAVVHLAGTETITGLKTFSSDLNVSDLYVNGYSGFSGRLSLKQANSVAFSGIGYTTVNALGTSALSINFRQTDGTNKTMQINANLIGAAARVFQFPDADGTVALTSQLHNAVTIGTANGLSLSTQVLSLGLASASTNGALSSTDWNTFNNKQNALTNPITGTGTANYLPKFTGSTALGNSLIYEIGSTIGIGTTSPFSALHISRNASELLRITRGSVSDFSFDLGASNDLYIKNNGVNTTPLTILGSGNVGIGTTSPNFKLEVNGSIQSGSGINQLGLNSGNLDFYNAASTNKFIKLSDDSNSINAIGFSKSGSVATTWFPSGNVGIGTTSPSEKLTVSNGKLALTTDDVTIGGKIYGYNDTSVNLYSGGLKFQTRYFDGSNYVYSDRLTLNSSGNVGIGTTSPDQLLTVIGNVRAGGVGNAFLLDTLGVNFTNGMKVVNNYETVMFSGRGSAGYVIAGDNNLRFGFGTNYSAGEAMRITSTGNVGIGTTSPRTPLEVFGNGLILSYSTSNASARDYLISTNYNAFGDFTINQANANGGNPYSAGTSRFYINSSGNVGIGTTSPAGKLSVIGDVIIGQYSDSVTNNLDIRTNKALFTISPDGVTNGNGTVISYSWANGGQGSLKFSSASGIVMTLTAGGTVNVTSLGTGLVYSNAGTLTSTNPSDSRLKDNIVSFNYGLSEILKLRPVSYSWKDDKINQGTQFGFIAQEVQEVMPELVKQFETKEGERLGLDKEGIYAALVNAIKELKTEIETLKK